MKHLTFKFKTPKVNIYPFTDWHVGSKQCDFQFIEHMVNRVKNDPIGYWLYLGDGGECVTKSSKGRVHEQVYDPGTQLKIIYNVLKPVMTKGLFGIRGNHGDRIDKDTGVEWDEVLCRTLNLPYAGVSAMVSLRLEGANNRRTTTSLYAHHGVSVATTHTGKIKAATKPVAFILADIILTGHSHGCGEVWPPNVYATLKNGRVKWISSRVFACGSAYDGRTGYAEEKLYSPITASHVILHLSQVRKGKHLTVSITPEFVHAPLSTSKKLGVAPDYLLTED